VVTSIAAGSILGGEPLRGITEHVDPLQRGSLK
jgi:hypothetical protein